jgi:hypothetical protein
MQVVNRRHVFGFQAEVEYVQVFSDALGLRRPRDNDIIQLQIPAAVANWMVLPKGHG